MGRMRRRSIVGVVASAYDIQDTEQDVLIAERVASDPGRGPRAGMNVGDCSIHNAKLQ
jgi:hypothetical protein